MRRTVRADGNKSYTENQQRDWKTDAGEMKGDKIKCVGGQQVGL